MSEGNGHNGNGEGHSRESITRAKQDAFLVAVEICGTIKGAVRASGTSRTVHRDWMSRDDEYRQRFNDAIEISKEALKEEARRRAIDGERKPVLYKGEQVFIKDEQTGTEVPLWETKRSDLVLLALLNAAYPEEFRYRSETTVKADLTIHQPNAPSDAFLRRCNAVSPNPETGSN